MLKIELRCFNSPKVIHGIWFQIFIVHKEKSRWVSIYNLWSWYKNLMKMFRSLYCINQSHYYYYCAITKGPFELVRPWMHICGLGSVVWLLSQLYLKTEWKLVCFNKNFVNKNMLSHISASWNILGVSTYVLVIFSFSHSTTLWTMTVDRDSSSHENMKLFANESVRIHT